MARRPATQNEIRCGAPLRRGDRTCNNGAGWGTDHPGEGPCRLHGKTAATVAPNQGPTDRGPTGRYEKTLESAERDREACLLRARGLTYQQISDQLGYGDRSHARRAVEDCITAVQAEGGALVRQLELDRLDEMHRHALAVLERAHVTVSNGSVMWHDGQPLLDDGPVLQAIDRLLRIQDRRAKLLGLDAPTRSRVEVVTDDIAQALVDQLEAELAALSASDPDRGPTGHPGPDR